MLELDTTTALDYLRDRGLEVASVELLAGGVSNTVLLAETSAGRMVLKQSLAKLRVKEDWFCERDRVFRECRALRELRDCLPPGSLPEVYFEDRDNFLFAMEAAPEGALPWKSYLMAGTVDVATAGRIGEMQRALITAGDGRPGWAEAFGGYDVFDQLRLDPYYRFTASRRPDLADRFERLINDTSRRRVSLVHGDWSPKNFLVAGERVIAIDFEVLHYGDPSFDCAFLLNHLLLKSFYRPGSALEYRAAAQEFWKRLDYRLDWFEEATLAHLGCLMLARVDGKSPVEYLTSEDLKTRVRRYARAVIQEQWGRIDDLMRRWPE